MLPPAARAGERGHVDSRAAAFRPTASIRDGPDEHPLHRRVQRSTRLGVRALHGARQIRHPRVPHVLRSDPRVHGKRVATLRLRAPGARAPREIPRHLRRISQTRAVPERLHRHTRATRDRLLTRRVLPRERLGDGRERLALIRRQTRGGRAAVGEDPRAMIRGEGRERAGDGGDGGVHDRKRGGGGSFLFRFGGGDDRVVAAETVGESMQRVRDPDRCAGSSGGAEGVGVDDAPEPAPAPARVPPVDAVSMGAWVASEGAARRRVSMVATCM